jgi:hypothetical protein
MPTSEGSSYAPALVGIFGATRMGIEACRRHLPD